MIKIKNEINKVSNPLNLSSFKLPKLNENNWKKSISRMKSFSSIRIKNNENLIPNYFSTNKIRTNSNKIITQNDNIIMKSESETKLSKLKRKSLYTSTANSFFKRNNEKNKEKELKFEDEDNDNIHQRKKYSKNLMDNLNNKLFSDIIATDILRPKKDKELIEQDFEKEVRKYQLLKIIELNQKIREGETVKSINDIKEIYDKNSNLQNSYFQIKEKEKKHKNLGIRGIKLKSLNLNDINKIKHEKEEEEILNEKEEQKMQRNNVKKNTLEMEYIKYLDLKLDSKSKKEKKKKIKNILIKDKKVEIGLNYFHSLSQVGINKDNTIKINQETILELINIFGNSKFNIFGIFSGHGKNGHIISRHVSRYLKEYFLFSENKLTLKKCKTNKELYDLFSKNNYSYIKQLIFECHYSLRNSQIDCDYSGTSCLLIILIEEHLICSNIGNNKAIILEKNDLFQIAFEQSLDIPEERRRIEKRGGKIIWINGDMGEQYRIIMKDNNNKSHYIEMSRSIGDLKFKKVGVDLSPVICEYIINDETKFVVAGTKGLWKILTNKQVAYYVNKGYKLSNPLEACRKLIQKANDEWKKESNSRDDISIFTLFF